METRDNYSYDNIVLIGYLEHAKVDHTLIIYLWIMSHDMSFDNNCIVGTVYFVTCEQEISSTPSESLCSPVHTCPSRMLH